MITREQAEQAFYQHFSQANMPEVRNPVVEQVDIDSVDLYPFFLECGNLFALESLAWKCTYEARTHFSDIQHWYPWQENICYIVEPKPGIYVLE